MPDQIMKWYLARSPKWRWAIWGFIVLAVALASAWWFMTQEKAGGGNVITTAEEQANRHRAHTEKTDEELERQAKDEQEKRAERERQAELDRSAAREAHARVSGADDFDGVDHALDSISRGDGPSDP